MTTVAAFRREQSPIYFGFYTVKQTARLAEIDSERKIRGWLSGYPRSDLGPVIHRQLEPIEGKQVVSFLDLIEMRFIFRFHRTGVTLRTIRIAAENARRELEQDHPFATGVKFQSDRRRIFMETAGETSDKVLLDLVSNNFASYEILEQSLDKGLEYDDVGLASRLYPRRAKYPHVVVDPKISFGQPAIDRAGVPTSVLYVAWKKEENNFDAVADWYEVDPARVREAVEFELDVAA